MCVLGVGVGASRVPGRAGHSAVHLQSVDEGHWSDRFPGTGQAGAEGELHRLGANDGPARTVVEQRPVGLLGTEGSLAGGPKDGTEASLVVQPYCFPPKLSGLSAPGSLSVTLTLYGIYIQTHSFFFLNNVFYLYCLLICV